MYHMSRMYLVDPGDTDAMKLTAYQEIREEISDIMPTEISIRYKDFIMLQYQHCCDEYEASSIIVANLCKVVAQADLGTDSFLQHCKARKVYCENQIRLLGIAYPSIEQYRRPRSRGRI